MKKILVLPLIFPVLMTASGQSVWTGATNGNYGTASNWSPASVPLNSADIVFGPTSGTTSVLLGGNRSVATATFADGAASYSISNDRLTLQAAGRLTVEYGVANPQVIGSEVGTAGAGIRLENLSLSPNQLVLNGNLTNSDGSGRLISFGGLGGGQINGNVVNGVASFGLLEVGGGGTWTFTGTNSSTAGGTTASTRLYLSNGATFIADSTTNNGAKLASGQQIQFSGGNLELRGNTAANTTATAFGADLTAITTAGNTFGFGSTIKLVEASGFDTTLNLGAITRNTTVASSYLRILGDGVVTTSTANTSGIIAGVFTGTDYAANNGSGVLTNYSSYATLGTSSAGSGSQVYSISGSQAQNLGSGTVLSWLGMKINTTGAGQSFNISGNTTTNFLSGSNSTLLFVGAHDYSISATTFGRADAGTGRAQTLINSGTGVLTISAAINTVAGNTAVMQFGGPGTTVLTQGATGTAGSVRIAEGILAVTNGNAFGSLTPSVSVQSGGTLQLRNSISLASANTLNLHGLGKGGIGALNSFTGDNTVSGNVVLGMTSRVNSALGASLDVAGDISGVAGERITLMLGGEGTTTISGTIGSTITRGLVKDGNGSVNLTRSAGNTYTGGTTVSAGSLFLNNATGSATGSGEVSVLGGATLGGAGSASGSVSIAGTLAPGNSVGTLSTGDLEILGTGSLAIELGSDSGNPVSDRVNVVGGVSLLSGANLELALGSGLGSPIAGDLFFLVSNDGLDLISGVFTQLNGVDTTLEQGSLFLFDNQQWQISYEADFGSSAFVGGNDIALQAVPEPRAWMLIGFGLAALVIHRLGRARRAH